jgi:hypothetical protein
LRHWCFALSLGIVGVVAVVFIGQLYMNKSIKSYSSQADAAQAELKVQKLDETQKRVSDISSSLQLVVQVLSREILFSKLITQIGAAIPSGAALSNLSISKLEGGIDLQFNAVDYQTATQVQVNLKDPNNKIFDKADIVNLSCNGNAIDPKYPCQVTVRAQFSKNNNPFLFINKSSAVAKP